MRRQLVILMLAASVLAGPAGAAEPLASVETNLEGLSFDVMAVERKGSVLTVKWAVRNDGTQATEAWFYLKGSGVRTYVVDEESGTKYYVLTDKEGNLLASQGVYLSSEGSGIKAKPEPGAATRLWMKLPAPPPEVSSVTLFFDGAVEPVEDVPIRDK